MKKFLLLQFISISILISGLLTSANTPGNIQKGPLMSNEGLVSLNTDTYDFTFGIQQHLDTAIYYDIFPDNQKEVLHTKEAVQNIDEAIANMLSSSDPVVIAEGQHLRSLAYDLNPTIYINNGKLSNPEGKSPKCVDLDASSVGKLYDNDPQLNQVEFITLRIEEESDLATLVNLDNLQNFPKLKYIYIHFTFNICSNPGCEATMISPMVRGTDNSDVLILYKISIPN
jgi:hypothetical protein